MALRTSLNARAVRFREPDQAMRAQFFDDFGVDLNVGALAIAGTLETLGIAGAVLGRSGELLAVTPTFERLVPTVIQDTRERVRLADAAADALLAGALDGQKRGAVHPRACSIPMPSDEVRPPLIVNLLPFRGATRDIVPEVRAIMTVTRVDRSSVPNAEVLEGLFDLTPAEARVAHGISEAHTVDALAEALGISRETVRTQLKAVLAKTGLSRQQELVSLLAGKALQEP